MNDYHTSTEQRYNETNSTIESSTKNVKPRGNIILNILIFIGWMLLSQMVILIIFGILKLSSIFNSFSGAILTCLFIVIATIITWLIRRYYIRHSYEERQKFKLKDIGINIGWAVLLRVLALAFSYLLHITTGSGQSENDKMLLGDANHQISDASQLPQIFPFLMFILTFSILTPYLEELIYRGIFKETLFSRAAFWLPLILSSLIFALQHSVTDIISILMFMFMGIIFYLAYSRRGNVRDSMMVHMIHNSTTGIILLIGYFYVLLH